MQKALHATKEGSKQPKKFQRHKEPVTGDQLSPTEAEHTELLNPSGKMTK